MDKVKKILFYSDSKIFGGHEIMSTKIANTLFDNNYKIEFMYYNKDFDYKLNENIKRYFNPIYDKTPLPFIANFNLFSIFYIYKRIKKINPDIIIVCQGNIEFSLKGLFVSKLLKKTTVSYIPFGYSFYKMNSKLSSIRDFINQYYYNLPNFFITPSLCQKNEILKKIKHQNISIINNPIYISPCTVKFNKENTIKLGLIGRINFKHKNQIISITIANKLKSLNIPFKITIIGDGEDLFKLKKIVKKNKLTNNFIFYKWMNKSELNKIIEDNIDIVLVPSKFETGIPLVIYDALENNKKFLLSKIDSIDEYSIPNEFLMDINNIDKILQKIIYLKNLTDINTYLKFKNYMIDNFSNENYNYQVIKTFKNITCGH